MVKKTPKESISEPIISNIPTNDDDEDYRDRLIRSKSRNFLASLKLDKPDDAVQDLEELLELLIQRYDDT